MHLFGAHMSIAGGVEQAFVRAAEVGCRALQIFTKNANQWRAKPLAAESLQAFRRAWRKSGIGPVLAHDSYLINLAAPDAEKWEKSRAALVDEMIRCHQLGVPALVMHPGAHLGSGVDAGIARVCEALRRIFREAPESVTVLLENTAGQGTYLGARFEELAAIMDGVPRGRFGVCFDTCHAFAAGHDLAGTAGYARVMDDFERLVGIKCIRAFHLNDSKKGCGARVDRHEHIGRGAIGEEGFRALVGDPRFAQIPMILETPKDAQGALDRMNLATLRRLAQEEG